MGEKSEERESRAWTHVLSAIIHILFGTVILTAGQFMVMLLLRYQKSDGLAVPMQRNNTIPAFIIGCIVIGLGCALRYLDLRHSDTIINIGWSIVISSALIFVLPLFEWTMLLDGEMRGVFWLLLIIIIFLLGCNANYAAESNDIDRKLSVAGFYLSLASALGGLAVFLKG